MTISFLQCSFYRSAITRNWVHHQVQNLWSANCLILGCVFRFAYSLSFNICSTYGIKISEANLVNQNPNSFYFVLHIYSNGHLFNSHLWIYERMHIKMLKKSKTSEEGSKCNFYWEWSTEYSLNKFTVRFQPT